jgi:hypothetical protein
MATAAPTVIIAIHGVGNPVTGEIEKLVKESLTAGRVENVDVREFNWNAPDLYPLEADKLKARSAEDLALGFLRAAGVGFMDSREQYAGFGGAGIAAHNTLTGAAHFFVALAFALALVLPFLTSLVLLPMHWFASYTAEQFRVIGWVLAGTVLAGLTALGLLLLLGAGYAVAGAGRRRGYAALTPLTVTARRALLVLLRPVVLIALPPFALPARTAAGRWVDILKYGNAAALLLFYPVIRLLWGEVLPFPAYVFATNGAVVTLVVMCWLAAQVTRSLVAPSLKILLDIFRYVSVPKYRDWIQQGLDEAIEEERKKGRRLFVLLAHSLGSVIAADSLINSVAWQPQDRVLLVTMGSPLRRFFFRFLPELFFPPSADAVGDAAGARLGDFRWANVYRPWDQVGARLGLTRRGSAERSTGQWGHLLNAHPNYWSDTIVRVQAEQAIKSILGLSSPGWTPDANRPEANPIIPQVEGLGGSAAVLYLALAAVLLVATPLAFGVASGVSKARWDADLAQKRDDLERHGAKADATVLHRVENYVEMEPVTRYYTDATGTHLMTEYQPKIRQKDQFEFHFVPQGGAEINMKVEIERDRWSEHRRFFDPDSLRNAVVAKGEALGKPSFWHSADYIGRQLKHVPLVYAADGPADPEAMWVLLPDHPPRQLTFKHVADWVGIVLLSLLVAAVGLAILAGGYVCFLYFVGTTRQFRPQAIWEGGNAESV